MTTTAITAQVEDYLVSRRAMGFDLRGEGYQLHAFARFANEQERRGDVAFGVIASLGAGIRCSRARHGSPPRGGVASLSEVLPPVRSALPGAPFGALRTRSSTNLSAYLHGA